MLKMIHRFLIFLCGWLVFCGSLRASEQTLQSPSLYESEMEQSEDFTPRSAPKTDHSGVWHWLIAISSDYESITLEDQSVWSICFEDIHKVLGWHVEDTLYVTQNSKLFDECDYRLINLNTGEKIRCKLISEPNGWLSPYAKWIEKINYKKGQVLLNDQSLFNISKFDRHSIKNWTKKDYVVIGINSGDLSWWNPNIIINGTTRSSARASSL